MSQSPGNASRTDERRDGEPVEQPANAVDALDAPDFSVEDTLNALLGNGLDDQTEANDEANDADGVHRQRISLYRLLIQLPGQPDLVASVTCIDDLSLSSSPSASACNLIERLYKILTPRSRKRSRTIECPKLRR